MEGQGCSKRKRKLNKKWIRSNKDKIKNKYLILVLEKREQKREEEKEKEEEEEKRERKKEGKKREDHRYGTVNICMELGLFICKLCVYAYMSWVIWN